MIRTQNEDIIFGVHIKFAVFLSYVFQNHYNWMIGIAHKKCVFY